MPGIIIGTPQKFTFADGNGGHLCTNTDGAPAVNQWDALAVNSNTTVATPAGWLAAETVVVNQGAYWFVRKATGGETASVTITTSGDHNASVHWIRLAATDLLDTSTSTDTNTLGTSTPAHSTGLLSATDELMLAFGAIHSIGAADQNTPTWSAGYTPILSSLQGSGADGVIGYTAVKYGAGTAAETPQVSWAGASAVNRYMLVLSFTTLAALTASGAPSAGAAEADGSIVVHEQTQGTAGGGWEQLKAIADLNRQLIAEDLAAGPVACPYCGEPLLSGPGDVQFCPAGDYRSNWGWR